MSNLKIFSNDIPVGGKRIIIRLDLNVPIIDNKIKDSSRIEVVLPFINELIRNNAKIIILSHLGRPKGKVEPKLSLQPIFDYLKKKLKGKTYFYKDKIDNLAIEASKNLKPGEVLLVENIRFFKEETDDEEIFAKNLSKLGDIYINEAFSCSHRKQASMHNITKFIDSYGGPILEREIQSINLLIKSKKKPVTCIIGGSKVSTKINILSSLLEKSDNLIIVGAMANNFLKFKGINVGASLVESDAENFIKEVEILAKKNKCNIVIPVDCNTSLDKNGSAIYKKLENIDSKEMILDIGKKTIELINKTIDESNTVFWNGPAGYYENKNFSVGTLSIGKKIAENTKSKSLISIVGGGDTVAAIKNTDLKNIFTHLSTAGGAFLESLEGKDLPGIKVLKKN